jgi:hypothetical protein
VIFLFMALPFFAESAPRAYRLKAGNADPPISTSTGTSPGIALGVIANIIIRWTDARTGKNRRHLLVGLLRQSVFGRLAGYEDVNDAERLCRDPAMRWVVGGRAPMGQAASASQMGRFETGGLARPENLVPLADLPGRWIVTIR